MHFVYERETINNKMYVHPEPYNENVACQEIVLSLKIKSNFSLYQIFKCRQTAHPKWWLCLEQKVTTR